MKTKSLVNKLVLSVFIAALPFSACKKNEEQIDPKQKKINELTALEKKQGNEVRAAVQPALTQPQDIQNVYWIRFNSINDPRAINLYDSTIYHRQIISAIRRPDGSLEANEANMNNFDQKMRVYQITIEELMKYNNK